MSACRLFLPPQIFPPRCFSLSCEWAGSQDLQLALSEACVTTLFAYLKTSSEKGLQNGIICCITFGEVEGNMHVHFIEKVLMRGHNRLD